MRASYDAYELVCISQIDYIQQTLAIYSTNDINIGFPDYYKEIKPDILDIENETARIREVKRQKSVAERAIYEYYFEAAEKLINYVKQIDKHIPIINECYTERLEKERQLQTSSKAGFIVGIVGVIIGIAGIIVAII